MQIRERSIDTIGVRMRYLTAGSGPAVVLLHAAGENSSSWQSVIPELARTHRVYAPDLTGVRHDGHPGVDYSPEFFARLVATFLAALGVDRAAVIGNSLGGLSALHLALSAPSRVTALGLVDSAGLGRAVHPAIIAITAPGYGELASAWSTTPLGALQRAGFRASLLFADPEHIPTEWYAEQFRLAQLPNFLAEVLAALRTQVDAGGQRRVLLDQLPRLAMPTLVVWGEQDLIFPVAQAREAIGRLRDGYLELIPDSGHLPQVEQPARCAAALARFLVEHAAPAGSNGRTADEH